MQNFKEIIKTGNFKSISISDVEHVTEAYPYFQFAKSLLLKKYRDSEHFKYNNTLKNVAAHTINREVLFNYINQLEKNKTVVKETTAVATNNSNPISVTNIIKEIEKPLEFNNSEKHSFNEWLKIKHLKPIVREEKNAPLQTKLNTIDQFLQNNPKISPLKKNLTKNSSVEKSIEDNSDQLMTETLAKVYTAQKKYADAIQAYKILSLKYPEKSTFFADQILRIEILQKNKS
ncbi:hypothetical protein [Wenyingzhuangia sp. IMCC45574]